MNSAGSWGLEGPRIWGPQEQGEWSALRLPETQNITLHSTITADEKRQPLISGSTNNCYFPSSPDHSCHL